MHQEEEEDSEEEEEEAAGSPDSGMVSSSTNNSTTNTQANNTPAHSPALKAVRMGGQYGVTTHNPYAALSSETDSKARGAVAGSVGGARPKQVGTRLVFWVGWDKTYLGHVQLMKMQVWLHK